MRELARRWRGRCVVVLGDVLLDRWLAGTPSRLCREAPAPVVQLDRVDDACGGAANTAVNLAALGASPLMVGAIGDDATGRRLRTLLSAGGVREALVGVPGRRTVVKSRLMAGDHLLARLDDGDTTPVGDVVAADLCDRLDRGLAGAAALVVCDYGAGTLTDRVRDWLAAARTRLPLLVVDAHDPQRWAPVRPGLVTPSFAELGAVVPAVGGTGRVGAVTGCAGGVLAATGAGVAAVTLDEDGAVVLRPGSRPYRTYARPAPPSRTAGAGDAYTAGFTLALVAGAGVERAAGVAQRAATVAIREPATCVCRLDRLLDGVDVPASRSYRSMSETSDIAG